MKGLMLLLMVSFMVMSLDARTVTTRRNLEVRQEVKESVGMRYADTIASPGDSLVVAGYDKMLRSTCETFFVVNSTSRHLKSISVTFTYYDMHGRMLHSRTAEIPCDIPGGETRQLSLPSWDTQQLFYYHASPAPRRAATPYTVTYDIVYAVVRNQ